MQFQRQSWKVSRREEGRLRRENRIRRALDKLVRETKDEGLSLKEWQERATEVLRGLRRD